jgi:UDP-glucose 4-epimerase
MKKILVTGNNGFVGKALVKRLGEEGYEVTGFDIDDGDIAGKDPFQSLTGRDFDYVFHLAGKTFVPDSWKEPFEFYRVNVLGTLNVLELCRSEKCGLTYVSSYVYGTPEYLPIDEKHPVKAYNPYSQSKILAEEVVKFYQENFDVQTCILRPFNIYGPGQPDNFLIPEMISKFLDENQNVVHVKDTRPKRDFLYVDDFIESLIFSMSVPREIFNVGSGRSVSVNQILEVITKITLVIKPIQHDLEQRSNEIFDLYSDINRISKCGWKPKINLEEGITECVEYYKSMLRNKS